MGANKKENRGSPALRLSQSGKLERNRMEHQTPSVSPGNFRKRKVLGTLCFPFCLPEKYMQATTDCSSPSYIHTYIRAEFERERVSFKHKNGKNKVKEKKSSGKNSWSLRTGTTNGTGKKEGEFNNNPR